MVDQNTPIIPNLDTNPESTPFPQAFANLLHLFPTAPGQVLLALLQVLWVVVRSSLKWILIFSLGGMALFLVAFVGSVAAVGYQASWPLYRNILPWIPLAGPAMVLLPVAIIGLFKLATRWIKNADSFLSIALILGVIVWAGYVEAHDEYERLQPQSTDATSLSASAHDQTSTLDRLSTSGSALLAQLQSTEQELSLAKNQLQATLTEFERQKQAATQVSTQLKQLDERQRAIALRTQELERILDGKQPITVEDLRHSGNMGLLWGFLIGILASIVANVFTSQFQKRRQKHATEN